VKLRDRSELANEAPVSFLETFFPRELDWIDQENPDPWVLAESDRGVLAEELQADWKWSDEDIANTALELPEFENMRERCEKAMRRAAQHFTPERKEELRHQLYEIQWLGRALTRASLARTLSKHSTLGSLPWEDVLPYVATIVDKTTSLQGQKKAMKEELRGIECDMPIPLCQEGRTMWGCFSSDDPEDPFSGVSEPDELLRRLGITPRAEPGGGKRHRYITLTYAVPEAMPVRYPTVLDAALDPLWYPGGKTRPVGNDVGDLTGGLPEGCHDSDPISSDCLRARIAALEM